MGHWQQKKTKNDEPTVPAGAVFQRHSASTNGQKKDKYDDAGTQESSPGFACGHVCMPGQILSQRLSG